MSASIVCSLSFTISFLIMVFCSIALCARNVKTVFHGTKTKYNSVVDGILRKSLEEQPFLTLNPPNCGVLQVNAVFRHGYRYPSLKDIIGFDALHESRIKGQVTAEQFLFLNDWVSPFDRLKEKELVAYGIKEIQDIAGRYQKHLLKLSSSFTADDIKLISSDRQRTIATAQACLQGILGEAGSSRDPQEFKIHKDEKLLRFYDFCPLYIDGIKNNKTALAEMHKFKDGALMREIARQVSSRLGLSKTLGTGDLKLISILTAFEEAIYGSSLWDGVLTADEIDTIEYATDLKSYWRKAYGYELNYVQSCPLIGDIFNYMDRAIEADFDTQGQKIPKGVFRFGHAETIFPLISTLGLFKPSTHLTADNYHEMRNEEFHSGLIAPMSANVAIVLYSCNPQLAVMHDNPEWPRNFSPYMVQVLVNEQIVKLPFCEHTLCPYETFQEHLYKHAVDCRFTDMCGIHGKHSEGHNEL